MLIGSCKNLHDDNKCVIWAEQQECRKNPDWMHVNCQKACQKCPEKGKTTTTTKKPTNTPPNPTTKKTTSKPRPTVDPRSTSMPSPPPSTNTPPNPPTTEGKQSICRWYLFTCN